MDLETIRQVTIRYAEEGRAATLGGVRAVDQQTRDAARTAEAYTGSLAALRVNADAARQSVVQLESAKLAEARANETLFLRRPDPNRPLSGGGLFLQNLNDGLSGDAGIDVGGIDGVIKRLQGVFASVGTGASEAASGIESVVQSLVNGFASVTTPASGASGAVATYGTATKSARENTVDMASAVAESRLAFGALGVGVGAAVTLFATLIPLYVETEKVSQRLNNALRATGATSGQTAESIDAMARRLSTATGAAENDVRKAATALTRFDGAGGANFERTLKLAKDLSSTLGTSLTSEAERLGRALGDPAKALDSLSEAGIKFSTSERQFVQDLVDAGQAAEAQRLLLDQLTAKVGGNAAAETNSLVGAFGQASTSVADLAKQLLDLTGASPAIIAALNGIAAAVRGQAQVLSGAASYDTGKYIADLQRDREEILRRVQTDKGRSGVSKFFFGSAEGDLAVNDVLLRRAEERRESETENRVQAGRLKSAEAVDKVIKSTRDEIKGVDKTYEGVLDKAEKAARYQRQSDEAIEKLNAQRGEAQARGVVDPDFYKSIDDAIVKRREVARRQIAALDQGAGGRSGDGNDRLDNALITSEQRRRSMEAEITLIGKAPGELERARVAYELEAAAKKANRDITDEVRAQIDAEAEARGRLVSALDRAKREYHGVVDAQNAIAETGERMIEDLIDGTLRLDSVLKSVGKWFLQSALLGKGPLAGLFGTSAAVSGQTGGLFGSLFGNALSGGGGLFGSLFGGGGAAAAPALSAGYGGDIGAFFGLFADGGDIPAGGWGIAGEAGPEIIRGPASVIPAKDIAKAAAGSSAQPVPMMVSIDLKGANGDAAIAAAVNRGVAMAIGAYDAALPGRINEIQIRRS